MLLANWDNYFLRMQNPEAQLPRIKKNCPTLYVVLMDEDKDNVIQLRHKNEKAFESGLGVICKVDGDTPILALRDKPILDKVTMLVNKVIDIYNELNANPPFPSWKEGLGDLWNKLGLSNLQAIGIDTAVRILSDTHLFIETSHVVFKFRHNRVCLTYECFLR